MLSYSLFNTQIVSLKTLRELEISGVPLIFTPIQTGSVIFIAWVFFNCDGIKQMPPLKDVCSFLQTQVWEKNDKKLIFMEWDFPTA